MTGFRNIRELVDAEENGQFVISSWRKTPTQVTPAGLWFDLSMSPGNPIPQYYAAAPLVSYPMTASDLGGLYHGANVPSNQKFVRQASIMTTTGSGLPMPMMLCDYLLYYPFVDEGTAGEQTTTQSYPLPRFSTGYGVQMMAVSVAGRTGGASFQVRYTNSDGIQNQISQTVIENSISQTGNIVTSERATIGCSSPFIPLQNGDKGVRSIEGITMNTGDVGLFTLVLVKPLGQMSLRGIDAPVEIDYFLDFSQVPTFANDAYLNFLCCPAGTLASTLFFGTIKTIWN